MSFSSLIDSLVYSYNSYLYYFSCDEDRNFFGASFFVWDLAFFSFAGLG